MREELEDALKEVESKQKELVTEKMGQNRASNNRGGGAQTKKMNRGKDSRGVVSAFGHKESVQSRMQMKHRNSSHMKYFNRDLDSPTSPGTYYGY